MAKVKVDRGDLFDENERCDFCGEIGAYDLGGACLCPKCVRRAMALQDLEEADVFEEPTDN